MAIWNNIEDWFLRKKANLQEMRRAKRRKNLQEHALGDNRVLLSPTIISPENNERTNLYRYNLVKELRNAIDSNNCYNIAITGAYGSGKSSIIQTYLAEMPPRYRAFKVLALSLSNFIDQVPEGQGLAYEKTIESKLFQHILFKANEDRTAQSHYKKIANISVKRALGVTMFFILAVLCFFVVFYPQHILSLKYVNDVYKWIYSLEIYRWIHGIIYLSAIIYMLYVLIRSTIYTIRRVRKVQIKGVEVEKLKVNFEDNLKTPFNELLDEILYFFRAGRYKIVIFEDLDRIANPRQLFLKLREINLLLNESDYYKRNDESIKFIYAIRDDLFESNIRTKCFDYIIPVVPVVDKHNAGDYMIKHYGKTIMKSVGARNLNVLGLFIRDKRELNNIVNEYAMSYETFINDTTSPKKLLAILVYKNVYPKDYAAAYRKEGCLYAIFNSENKKDFYEPVIMELQNKEKEVDDEITQTYEEIVKYRGDILNVLKMAHITRMRYKGVDYPIDDFVTNDSLYTAFVNNKIESFKDANNVRHPYEYEYTKLAEEANSVGNVVVILNEKIAKITKLQQELHELRRKIDKKKTAKISALIKEQDSTKTLENIKKICAVSYEKENLDSEQQEEHAKLMLTFLREEFVAEDYPTYMSLMYEGSLTDNDFRFVHAVLQDIALEYDQPVNNCSAVIQHLSSDDYQKRSILNDMLIDSLLQMKDNVNLRDVIDVVRKDFDFILHYEVKSKQRAKFLQKLFDNWKGAVSEIAAITNETQKCNGMLRLYWECAPRDVALEETEKEFLEERYDYVCQNLAKFTLSKVEQFVKHHSLKFAQLLPPDEQTQVLFDYVTKNCHFIINIKNLRVIYGKEFEQAAYTQIYTGRKEILEYVLPKFNALLDKMAETSIYEEPDSIVKLINKNDLDFDLLLDYINKQKTQIELNNVDDSYVKSLIEKTNLVRPSWENLNRAYIIVNAVDTNILVQFVKRNIVEFVRTKCGVENAYEIEKMLLLETNEFEYDEYNRLAECFTAQMSKPELENTSVSDEYMRILIANGLLLFDSEMFDYIEANYSIQILATYVIANYASFVADEDIVPKESNVLGIEILNSSLTLEEKRQYMAQYPFDKEGEKAEEYAGSYCFYCNEIGDYANVYIENLIDAMGMIGNGEVDWRLKMSMINQINRTLEYNQERETQLLNTLGDPYNHLSHYGYHTLKLDNNLENTELLKYLKKNHPFVSDVKPTIWNQWKVTFRHKSES